jgi:hypothetical protein
MGIKNSTFLNDIKGLPNEWDFTKNYDPDKVKKDIQQICELIKNIPKTQDIEKFVRLVEEGLSIELNFLLKISKIANNLSPFVSIIIIIIKENTESMEESLKSYCKSEISKEISDYLILNLKNHLNQVKYYIEKKDYNFASDHARTALGLVKTFYEEQKFQKWYNSIGNTQKGLNLLVNILFTTKMISDLYLDIIEKEYFEDENIKINTMLNDLIKLIVLERGNSIVINTNIGPKAYL